MTPAELSRTVLHTVRRAVAAEELRVAVPEKVVVQRPPRPGCGDYATNVALQLARAAGQPPYAVAEILARRLEKEPGIAQVQIAGAGFLNITLSGRAYGEVVQEVRARRERYGWGDGLAEVVVTVAAVEPGALRGPVVAEVVNRLLRAAGARAAAAGAVTETLIVQEPVLGAEWGDGGGRLGAGPGLGLGPTPELGPGAGPHPGPGGSPPVGTELGPGDAPPLTVDPASGGSLVPVAHPAPGGAVESGGDRSLGAGSVPPLDLASSPLGLDATRWALLRPPAEDVPRLSADLLVQRESNPLFRIRYARARACALLRNACDLGVPVDSAEGADLDSPTGHGLAADLGLAVLPADGTDPTDLADPGLPADLGVATAPADRAASGEPAGGPASAGGTAPADPAGGTDPGQGAGPAGRMDLGAPAHPEGADPGAPAQPAEGASPAPAPPPYLHPAETELLGLIADYPRVIESAARRRVPDRVARHLERLADAFFRFHDECPPLPKGDEKPSAAHAARVRLADATGIVLVGGLHLLGISAPDLM